MITKQSIHGDIRALTLLNPWPYAITTPADDPKRLENRSWAAPQSLDTFLIHAGKGWDRNAPASLTLGAYGTPTSAIVAAARLNHVCGATVGADAPRCGCGRWAAPGQYHWVFSDVLVLPRPMPCAGRLGLWRPPLEVLAAVREQLS